MVLLDKLQELASSRTRTAQVDRLMLKWVSVCENVKFRTGRVRLAKRTIDPSLSGLQNLC